MIIATKSALGVPSPRPIAHILDEWSCLDYSTQKRNMAAWLMFLEYLESMLAAYAIGGGVEKLMRYDMLRISSDIIETALFCALRQKGIKLGSKPKAGQLVGIAKKKGLISKKTAVIAARLVEARNDLHADRQKHLHLKIKEEILTYCSQCIKDVRVEVATFLAPESRAAAPPPDELYWEPPTPEPPTGYPTARCAACGEWIYRGELCSTCARAEEN